MVRSAYFHPSTSTLADASPHDKQRTDPMTDPISSRRICLVLQSGIGDVVHGLPLVNALKRDDPGCRISWIVQRAPAPLLFHHPAVDDIILFDRRRGWREVRELWRQLRSRAFDVVLNCGIYFKSAVPTLLARAPHKIGFGPDRAFDLVWLSATQTVDPRSPRHRQDMYLELVEFLGIDPNPLEWRITLTEDERARQAEFFTTLSAKRVVGLVTTSAMASKNWPVDRFAELATALQRDYGLGVILLGGPGAKEQERARRILEASETRPVWALGPDLRWLVSLLAACDLAIAPDTGPLHIARALRTPVIGLYGHTNPRLSGPYRAFEDLVVDRYNYDAPGMPYTGPVESLHPARPGDRPGRMQHIRVVDVIEKVELALRRYIRDES
jgi:heptosyltransferase I